jgi:hypothetical protein
LLSRRRWRAPRCFAGCAAPKGPSAANAGPVAHSESDESASEKVSLTIYNQNFGLVREVRSVHLGKGQVELSYADVSAHVQPDRKQTEWHSIGNCTTESAWEVELRNHKDNAVDVEDYEPVAGDWTMLSSSQAANKKDSSTFTVDVKIPPRGTTKVTYKVRVKWCCPRYSPAQCQRVDALSDQRRRRLRQNSTRCVTIINPAREVFCVSARLSRAPERSLLPAGEHRSAAKTKPNQKSAAAATGQHNLIRAGIQRVRLTHQSRDES